jgi:hypothetical protein
MHGEAIMTVSAARADLVTALRIYHPLVVDPMPIDGGRYLLSFVPPALGRRDTKTTWASA